MYIFEQRLNDSKGLPLEYYSLLLLLITAHIHTIFCPCMGHEGEGDCLTLLCTSKRFLMHQSAKAG